MLKDITLGQYFPGKSPVHRLDPRTKLIVLVAYIVALFAAKSWISYGICFAFLAITIGISTIPVKSIVKGARECAHVASCCVAVLAQVPSPLCRWPRPTERFLDGVDR